MIIYSAQRGGNKQLFMKTDKERITSLETWKTDNVKLSDERYEYIIKKLSRLEKLVIAMLLLLIGSGVLKAPQIVAAFTSLINYYG
jgi:hypothetical protein